MMLCPKCGQDVADQEVLCPHCGECLTETQCVEETTVEEVTVEETTAEPAVSQEAPAAEVSEAAAEEAAPSEEGDESTTEDVEPSEENEEVPAEETASAEQPKKKKSGLAILAGIIIALLLIVVVGLGLALKYVSDGGSLSELAASLTEKKLDAEAKAVTVQNASGETITELDNRMLSFYYWGEYYYFVNSYGFQFDSTLPLDEQVYEEVTDSATGTTTVTTWHDYFLDCANYSITQIEAMKAEGQAAGFVLPEDYQTEYDTVIESMATNAASAGFVDEAGNGDALAYIQDSYGEAATIEAFEQYLYDSYYASAYSDEIYYSFTYETEDLESYFEENADYFASYGVEKSDIPNVNVRHILIEPTYEEDGTITDESWEAAEAQAQEVLDEWKAGDATEDSFAELANTYSADTGSNTSGGLYDNVYPGEMVEAFNDWCFDDSRQTGDTDIVKTDYGYHIMYFVGYTDEYYYLTVAESDMRYYEGNAYLEEMVAGFSAQYTEDADVRIPAAVKTIMETESTTEAAG